MAQCPMWILVVGLAAGSGCSGESIDDDDTRSDDDVSDDDTDTADDDTLSDACDDLDGDGYSGAGDCYGDCNEDDPEIHPGAEDTVGDGVDNNCDGVDGVDADEDGHASVDSGGDDCDDFEYHVHPGALEACDEIDRDCDPATTGEQAVLVDGWWVRETFEDALDLADDGSELLVCPGVYVENIYVSAVDVTIASLDGSGSAIVQPLLGSALWVESANLSVSGLTLREGTGTGLTLGSDVFLAGGGIRVVNSGVTVTDVVIEDSTSEIGAGIVVSHGSLVATNLALSGNVATEAGGGVYVADGGSVSLSQSTVADNHALGAGGGAFVEGTLVSAHSDWGTGDTDNHPDDVSTAAGSYSEFGLASSFSCDAVGCQ